MTEQQDLHPRPKAMKPEECDMLIFEFARQKDLDGILSLFEEEAVWILDDGNRAEGHAQISVPTAGLLDAVELKWLSGPHAFVSADGTLAVCSGEWSASFQDENGNVTTVTDRNMEVVRKQADGSWKFVIDHGTAGSFVAARKNA
ncbi:YybH family protein [Pasteurella testudinis]|uniref:YybH family protein n=1 Tax=Pasteurella testudinis TaxID=761 RepID=UPI00405904CA